MGNSTSLFKTKELTGDERRRRALEERGILIPPLFIFGQGSPVSASLQMHAVANGRLSLSSSPIRPSAASLMTRLQHESLTHTILTDFLQPGLWVTSATNRNGAVVASLCPSPLRDGMTNPTGGLYLSQNVPSFPAVNFNLWCHSAAAQSTSSLLSPMIMTGSWLVTPSFKLSSQLHASTSSALSPNDGWLSCQYKTQVPNIFVPPQSEFEEYYQNNPFSDTTHNNNNSNQTRTPSADENRFMMLHMGSWCSLHQEALSSSSSSSSSSSCSQSSIPIAVKSVNAYASLQVPGCLLAVEGTLPTASKYAPPYLSYFISCDLLTASSSDDESSSSSPPLTIQFQKSPTHSSMGLSQVLSFDRYSFNPLETRAPKIRNTVAWTMEMIHNPNMGSTNPMNTTTTTTTTTTHYDDIQKQRQQYLDVVDDYDDTGTRKSSSSSGQSGIQAGVVWQLNRAVALKAVLLPTGLSKAAIIFQRWQQPQVTVSCMYSSNGTLNASVAVDIGGGSMNGTSGGGGKIAGMATPWVVPSSPRHVPETKATLPDEN